MPYKNKEKEREAKRTWAKLHRQGSTKGSTKPDNVEPKSVEPPIPPILAQAILDGRFKRIYDSLNHKKVYQASTDKTVSLAKLIRWGGKSLSGLEEFAK